MPNNLSVNTMDMSEEYIIDTSETKESYFLRGKNGAYIKLSADAFHLLQVVRSGASFDTVAATLSSQYQRLVTSAEIEEAYQRISDTIHKIENNDNTMKSGFFYRRDIFSQPFVSKISHLLTFAFTPLFTVCCIGLIIVSMTMFFFLHPINMTVDYDTFWIGVVVLLFSMIAHEFGHATACSYFNAKPGAIGFGLYLIYPMFYSDVSSAWELKRWQRVVVDLAGVYFQMVICALYVFLYLLSGWDGIRFGIVMIIGSCVFSINPVFKFDGYWLVADALGVTNLSKQPKRILRYVMDIMQQKTPEPLPWSFATTASLVAYSLVSFVFWILFIWATIPMLWHKALVYPHQVYTIVQQTFFSTSNLRYSEVMAFLTSSFQLLLLMLMLRGIVMLIANPVLRFLKKNIFPSRASGTML
jgi:putative peptide zinc metalloprotease protein